ncbi:hypothetical protein [Tomitella cavernea]|uniref:Uncharacterized protein n=1 Tax=Tomitella cavernea TaxID=1387982 RepID=A0ABP9CKC7_9ACTN|nr:hypothetical protein [Tomitella cavernea]
MPDDVIARAELAMDGVTEGPWIAEYSREQGNCVIPGDAESTRKAVCVTRLYHQAADAAFIAAARTLVPDLAVALWEARADAREVEARAENVRRGASAQIADLRSQRDDALAEVERLRPLVANGMGAIGAVRDGECGNCRRPLAGGHSSLQCPCRPAFDRLDDECDEARAERDRDCAEMVRLRGEVAGLRDRLGDLADEPYLSDRLREARASMVRAWRYVGALEKQQRHEHGEAWAKEYTAARQAEDEHDEARAAIARVREAVAGHPVCDVHPDGDPVTCGWKRAVADVRRALDGDA